jgi:hypothetical protein
MSGSGAFASASMAALIRAPSLPATARDLSADSADTCFVLLLGADS